MAEAEGFPAAVGGPASVDYQGVAVDEGALLRIGQEGDGFGDVVGSGEACHRDAAGDVGVGVAAAGLVGGVHFGFNPAGADCVDAHAAGAPFGSQGAGQADQSVLGSVVGGAIGHADQAGDGG